MIYALFFGVIGLELILWRIQFAMVEWLIAWLGISFMIAGNFLLPKQPLPIIYSIRSCVKLTKSQEYLLEDWFVRQGNVKTS
jgi:hypothetical protein